MKRVPDSNPLRRPSVWAALILLLLFAGTLLGDRPAQAPLKERLPQLVDITASTGIHFVHLSDPQKKYILESMSGGVLLIDYDRDGWPDIYFTNAPSVANQIEPIPAGQASSPRHTSPHKKFSIDVVQAGSRGRPRTGRDHLARMAIAPDFAALIRYFSQWISEQIHCARRQNCCLRAQTNQSRGTLRS
jgi:hypothetical protein